MMFATWVLEVNQLSQEFMDPNLVKAKLIITSGKGQVLAAGTAGVLVIDKFSECGLRSLGVSCQEVPAGKKESMGELWEFIRLLPLFNPPQHDSSETIIRGLWLMWTTFIKLLVDVFV
ncbi:uncharacterized protein LOC110889281 isoform X1 [Helianthus annuus]|uniref:uncharacterized protein LOC110889281 isoform X1 n=1 Tax=Helianthus annuus TaxID=4232 RepID=UPI000B905C7A|nr:uncharacterized protein LOC110889281 isoform X1 [Helianthus annuus]